MEKEAPQPKQDKNVIVDKIKEVKDKTVSYIKRNPKNVLYTMIALTIISIISNILYYNYDVKNAKVSYKQMSDKLFDPEVKKIDQKQDVSILQQAGNYLEMKKDLDKLKTFQSKKILSKQDSAEIKRITQKYNLR